MGRIAAIATTTAAIALAGFAGGTGSAPAERAEALPRFEAKVLEIQGPIKRRMTGTSWHPGCPVPRSDLRLIRAPHVDFSGDARAGRIIVHEGEVREIRAVLRKLYAKRFPIRRMRLIDRYGGSDHRSMAADNTSAFNCRVVAGTSRWSMHAYGKAIDLNPVENPYVTPSGHVSPPAGRPYADRSRHAEGMIHRGDVAYRAFRRQGWKWGGDWPGTKDFQHFSTNGS